MMHETSSAGKTVDTVKRRAKQHVLFRATKTAAAWMQVGFLHRLRASKVVNPSKGQIKLTTRLGIKRTFDALHVSARTIRRATKGICGRESWSELNRNAGLSAGNRTYGQVVHRTAPKAPSRRDKIRAMAKSHQSQKGMAS